MNTVKEFHPTLMKYKNIHKGDTCYIFGSGPSVNNFKIQEEGTFISCNHIIKNKFIKNNTEYYFFGHGYLQYNKEGGIYGNHQQEVRDLGNRVNKFCMVSRDNDFHVHKFNMEEVEKLKHINALPCDVNCEKIYKDLDKRPFLNHSIVFPAVQFALWCGFGKIYIVGCDCHDLYTKGGYFWNHNKERKIKYDKDMINWWEKMYQFKNKNYPSAMMISINPDGLKGKMDKDIFSK